MGMAAAAKTRKTKRRTSSPARRSVRAARRLHQRMAMATGMVRPAATRTRWFSRDAATGTETARARPVARTGTDTGMPGTPAAATQGRASAKTTRLFHLAVVEVLLTSGASLLLEE